MPNKRTKMLNKVANILEYEANEYIAAAKDDGRNRKHFGRRAQILKGRAIGIRKLAATGYWPSRREIEEVRAAKSSEVIYFGSLARMACADIVGQRDSALHANHN